MEDLKVKSNQAHLSKSLLDIMKTNISEYFMFIALIVIMIFFTITTDGVFISSRNISNLINQMGYIAVLAVGMTLIIVIRHIELSVGYLAGFLGAFSAIALTFWGWPIYAVIPAVMILGILGRHADSHTSCQTWCAGICLHNGCWSDLQRSLAAGHHGHWYDCDQGYGL